MTWLLIAILAQIILASSALADKLILKKSLPNPVAYTFWLGTLGLVAALMLPFGWEPLETIWIFMAICAGGVFMAGMLFYFHALFYGKAGGAIVAVAGFSPIATLLFSSWFLGTTLGGYQIASFSLLVFGGLLIAFLEERVLRLWAFFYALVAAGFFGASNVLAKLVFEEANFVTVFFWMKVGGALFALVLLEYPIWRERIFANRGGELLHSRGAYLFNRVYAGVGSVLIFYALSLGVPPLVDATQSIRFLVVFIGGWLLLHERRRISAITGEFAAFTLISVAVITLGVGDYLAATRPDPGRAISWGVTFSQKFAESFGVPWQETYRSLFDDLGVKRIRLIAYWDRIESVEGEYDFSDLDYQINVAQEHGVPFILAVGQKLPRWPECHEPEWVRNQNANIKNQKLFRYIEAVAERYKEQPNLRYWQIENEPFLPFGECGAVSRRLVEEEISLVRSIDPMHSILTTDSGEIGLWYSAAKRGDVFGTTMYRKVHTRLLGYIEYPLPPGYFRIKENLARFFLHDYSKKIIVVELQGEPWMTRQLYETKPEEQYQHFDQKFFADTVSYAKNAGFDEYYIWGVEWWYWLGVRHGNWEYWNIAKALFTAY